MKLRIIPALNCPENWTAQELLEAIINKEKPIRIFPEYNFTMFEKDIAAKGLKIECGFLVIKGSTASLTENSKLHVRHKRLRRRLINDGILKQQEKNLIFTRPCLFQNEYEATGVIVGNNRIRPKVGKWIDAFGNQPFENYLIGDRELSFDDLK